MAEAGMLYAAVGAVNAVLARHALSDVPARWWQKALFCECWCGVLWPVAVTAFALELHARWKAKRLWR